MSPPSSPTPSERSRADAAARAKQAEEQSRLPYKWTQTIRDVDVLVPVPPNLRGRDIDASITKTHLRIGIKGQSPPIIDGPLTHPVLVDESAWTLETLGDGKGKEVNVHLDKSNKMEWWDAVVQNAEYKIDTSKIVPEDSKLGDLDGETRGMVEKMITILSGISNKPIFEEAKRFEFDLLKVSEGKVGLYFPKLSAGKEYRWDLHSDGDLRMTSTRD
ncbi:MAG: hypothetical protein LQ351_000157 [Letrouitia transgressa]|nr:MAG: hypothetical protein LQ351_000157 [Letrouitia transgressa]